jgi:hypothetical protein
MQPDQQNTTFKLAADLVNYTSQSIFLTGKAGTGKTTFLKYIKNNTKKNTVIVAPTGVAAINAGGVTMHSFFQLPFGPYVPQSNSLSKFNMHADVADSNTLFRNIRFDKNKRTLLKELDLLIIDEISMVRADMLDAIDIILRHFRQAMHLPFGGVQVLYIGDLYQLPPVVPEREWQLLQDYYNSHFFFDAQVCKQQPPLYIELKKIYRQTDEQFIKILNSVRNNNATPDEIEILNDQYDPNAAVNQDDSIVLTSHNAKADSINQQELYKLTTPNYVFKGTVEGDFNDKMLPNDLELNLKEGAKIMFIKNDTSPEKKYYNGKLAIIKKMDASKIIVQLQDDSELYTLKKETWRNVKYKLNDANQIDEEELGSYTQYPIRLAWAVTIHKSQGLTFEKVVIDAGKSFAAGQVYVALSRCTTMQGITLQSKITKEVIKTDDRILAFAKQEAKNDELQRIIDFEKDSFLAKQLLKEFDFSNLLIYTQELKTLVESKRLPNQEDVLIMVQSIILEAQQISEIANKFSGELKTILNNDISNLLERIPKSQNYFNEKIIQQILNPLRVHYTDIIKAEKVKLYKIELQKIIQSIFGFLVKLNTIHYDKWQFDQYLSEIETYNPIIQKSVKTKEEKIPSVAVTYQLYLEGNNAEQIGVIRNLASTTIEGHLAQLVRKGLVDINKLVSKNDVLLILDAIQKTDSRSTTAIKLILPEQITHNAVRAVLNYKDWQAEKNATTNS